MHRTSTQRALRVTSAQSLVVVSGGSNLSLITSTLTNSFFVVFYFFHKKVGIVHFICPRSSPSKSSCIHHSLSSGLTRCYCNRDQFLTVGSLRLFIITLITVSYSSWLQFCWSLNQTWNNSLLRATLLSRCIGSLRHNRTPNSLARTRLSNHFNACSTHSALPASSHRGLCHQPTN
jgi:hypothetical protein